MMAPTNLRLRDNRWYGRRADLPDPRDFLFHVEHRAAAAAPLPAHFDNRDSGLFTPCYDQGQLGSCVANASAAAYDFEQKKQGEAGFTPSRLAIYYWGRAIEGTIRSDSGIECRDGVKALAKMGAPHEALWPYSISRFTNKPTARVVTDAKKHIAIQYARVSNTPDAHDICASIASGHPVIIGITVFESFEEDGVAKSGKVPMPDPSEQVLGGHCMLAVGYTTDPKAGTTFTVRNSWGTSWGDGGYCYIPGAYLIDPQLASDFWMVSTVK